MADPKRPKVVLDPSCVWQPDLDTAAVQGLAGIPAGGHQEQAGVIYQDAAGNYCYSTTAPGDEGSFDIAAVLPQGGKLAGTFHNHPVGHGSDGDSRQFSPQDIAVARQLGVPSYTRAEVDNGIRRFVPGTTSVRRTRRGSQVMESSPGDALDSMQIQAIVAALRGGK